MWVFASFAVAILAFGAYTAIDAQRDYMKISDEIDEISAKMDAYTARFPTAVVDGEEKPDLREASQDELMILAMQERDKREASNRRVEPDNRRREGLRIIGFGVVGLALAYLVSPGSKPPASELPDSGAP
jgi:hypothetical protein